MSSLADFVARAQARTMQTAHATSDITMGNVQIPPGAEEGYGSDDETTGNDTGTIGHENLTFGEISRHTNTTQHEDLTVEEAARLVQRYGLPEGTVSDVQTFQQVFFLSCLRPRCQPS